MQKGSLRIFCLSQLKYIGTWDDAKMALMASIIHDNVPDQKRLFTGIAPTGSKSFDINLHRLIFVYFARIYNINDTCTIGNRSAILHTVLEIP